MAQQEQTQRARIIIAPNGELVVVRAGETDAQALAAHRSQPRVGLIGTEQPEQDLSRFGTEPGVLPTILKTMGLGASMAIPGVRPASAMARGLTSGAFGAGANAMEGESPLSGFLWNYIPEMLGAGVAARAPRGGVKTALRTSGLNMTEKETKETTDAFMREAGRSRQARQKPIRVGEQGVPEQRMEQVGAQMRSKEQQSSYRPNVATAVEVPRPGQAPTTVGEQLQEGTAASFNPGKLDRALDRAQREFLASQVYKRGKDVYKHLDISEEDILALPDDELMKWAQSTDMRAEEFGDLTRALKREARPIIRQRVAGEYVPPAQAIREGDLQSQMATRGQDALKQNIPGLEEDLARYSDLARIEGVNDSVRETIGKASVRGGMAGAQGGAVAGRAGGLFGGLAGMLASPKRISGVGFKAGRVFEPNRMMNPINIARTGDITEDFVRQLMALMYGPQDEER